MVNAPSLTEAVPFESMVASRESVTATSTTPLARVVHPLVIAPSFADRVPPWITASRFGEIAAWDTLWVTTVHGAVIAPSLADKLPAVSMTAIREPAKRTFLDRARQEHPGCI